VAIVGGGIGAATTSFYLKENLPLAEIVVYEKSDRMGGRLDHITIDNHTLEARRIHIYSAFMVLIWIFI
jgi:protoporphyrinogen oxidase